MMGQDNHLLKQNKSSKHSEIQVESNLLHVKIVHKFIKVRHKCLRLINNLCLVSPGMSNYQTHTCATICEDTVNAKEFGEFKLKYIDI